MFTMLAMMLMMVLLVVNPVDELRSEMRADDIHDGGFHLFVVFVSGHILNGI